ncbi:hypothetical protein EFT87_09840 [Schleiferilactobacillus harbinensis]|jgi:hypothetical protein|uniref:Uncharacterized protein n=2 Tax=Schleiferilactobacillus harbinensis TaxID=304207 RepID=A0A0R1X3N4_9LACO|nr:hypothetical protein FC91_GL001319 [Schleiferilactobacillus harbinensis DSM 16991]MCT2908954.1 hypothetical protein [Schleiferilactobacillus harbinensis]GEK06898.1 hypothetical protein LHA01_21370 [Schleiferilactobacillus harbinensis]
MVMDHLVLLWLLGYAAVVAAVAFGRAFLGRGGRRFQTHWENFLGSFLRGVFLLVALAIIMFGSL